MVIENDEGQVDQEIDIAKNLIALSKESMMNKNLRAKWVLMMKNIIITFLITYLNEGKF